MPLLQVMSISQAWSTIACKVMSYDTLATVPPPQWVIRGVFIGWGTDL